MNSSNHFLRRGINDGYGIVRDIGNEYPLSVVADDDAMRASAGGNCRRHAIARRIYHRGCVVRDGFGSLICHVDILPVRRPKWETYAPGLVSKSEQEINEIHEDDEPEGPKSAAVPAGAAQWGLSK